MILEQILKLRDNNFNTITKRKKLPSSSDSYLEFYDIVQGLFDSTSGFLEEGIRLLGVTVTDFKKENYQSINLFDF